MNTLEDSKIRAVIDAACGGKIRSLISKRTGREFLYQDTRTTFSSESYSQHDISGLDECFPTVAPCAYPHGKWEGLPLGDHGWLWNRPWKVAAARDGLCWRLELAEAPLTFSRSIRLDGLGVLLLQYTIENQADVSFEFLYANHLMLFADHTTQVEFPMEMRRAYVLAAYRHKGLTAGSWIDWPPSSALEITPQFDPRRGTLVKVFSPRLTQGEAAISHGDEQESLRIAFDSDRLPYLGVLVAQGFDPLAYDGQGIFLGLEATTGIGDDLADCRATGTTAQLPPGEALRFHVRLSIACHDT